MPGRCLAGPSTRPSSHVVSVNEGEAIAVVDSPAAIPRPRDPRATIRTMEPRGDGALAERFEAALDRMGAYFMGSSPVQEAATQIARLLSEMKIDYAIAGALCLAAHGVVRATEDVDVLIAREGLERFKQAWLGRGYVNVHPGGKLDQKRKYWFQGFACEDLL